MNGYVDYELAKMRIEEDHHWADQERLAREARAATREARAATHEVRQVPASSHEEHPHVGFSLKRLITRLAWT